MILETSKDASKNVSNDFLRIMTVLSNDSSDNYPLDFAKTPDERQQIAELQEDSP